MVRTPPVDFVAESRQDERSRGGGTMPKRGAHCGMIRDTGRLHVTGFGKLRIREISGSVSSSFENPFFKVVEKGTGAGVGAYERAGLKEPEHDPSSFLSPWCTAPQIRSGRMNSCLQQQGVPLARSRLAPGVPSTVSYAIAVASTRERAFLSAQGGRLSSAKPDE